MNVDAAFFRPGCLDRLIFVTLAAAGQTTPCSPPALPMENLLASCLLIFGLIFAEAQPAGHASWTAADGRVIQARFIKLDGSKLTIEKDGCRFTLDLSALLPESAAQARKLARPSSAAQEPIQIKVLVLNYDPKFQGQGPARGVWMERSP